MEARFCREALAIAAQFLFGIVCIAFGAICFWLPLIGYRLLLHAFPQTTNEIWTALLSIAALVLLQILMCLTAVECLRQLIRFGPSKTSRAFGAVLMVYGIWLFGAVFLSISWWLTPTTRLKVGEWTMAWMALQPSSTMTAIMATYDGTMAALFAVTLILGAISAAEVGGWFVRHWKLRHVR